MACPTNPLKIDSNSVSTRYAFEVCIGELPGEDGSDFAVDAIGIPEEELAGTSPVFHLTEPNSFGDFGPNFSNTVRRPITDTAQLEKGVRTDLDAAANFQLDLTTDNFERLAPTFFFAGYRRQPQFGRSSQETITGVASNVISGTGIDTIFTTSDLVIVRRFATDEDDVLRTVSSTAAGEITVSGTIADATPGATAYVKRVGVETAAGDVDVDASGTSPVLTSTVFDFTTLNVIAGQWIYIGEGTGQLTSFTSAVNNGYARVKSVSANALELDKTQNVMVDEANTAQTVRIFVSDLIRNEPTSDLIVRNTVQIERSLGGAGFEYVKGCFANTLAINLAGQDKVTVDLGFLALDTVYEDDSSRKAGTFPAIDTDNEAFNTVSDFARIRLSRKDDFNTALNAFLTEATINVSNSGTAAKALGTLGAFEITRGFFTVGGNITAYFSDIASVQAIRENADVSFDFTLALNNRAWVFDIPLVALGDGRLQVEQDTEIKIPITFDAGRDTELQVTMIACFFPFVPAAATV